MKKNKYSGKFLVFEGIDGSGKSTQMKLLVKNLKKAGYKTEMIDFPQYGQKSAGPVEEYLNGRYGGSEEVGPYRASIFFACDHFDGSFKIKKWLKEGKIVVSDRYFHSNIGHQGGKIKDRKKRKKYLKWLFDMELNIFGIPNPDFTFILKVPPKISQSLVGRITDKKKKAKKKLYLGNKKRDLHEKDINHLINTERSYLEAAREFPKDFTLVECMEKNKLLSSEVIHQKIWKIVKRIL